MNIYEASKRPRIGLLATYFGLFDSSMPTWFRDDRTGHAERMVALLESVGEVVFPGIVDSDSSASEVGQALYSAGVDVIVISPTMAAPPRYVDIALAATPETPVVIVGAQDHTNIPDDYETTEATRRSLTVGYVMITNVLLRKQRTFLGMFGSLEEDGFEDRLVKTLAGACAAAALRGKRFLAVGDPIDGYDDVAVSAADLAALGIDLVQISRSVLSKAFHDVEPESVKAEMLENATHFDVTAVDAPVHERSARLTCALRAICGHEKVVGGTVNCHSNHFRWNPDIGITACLPVTKLTAADTPFSCTGDVPTAIALRLGRSIAGAALYCEIYQLDMARNWLLIANGGEGDTNSRALGTSVRLLHEDHYMGDRGPGTAVAFRLGAGPATLISLSPMSSAAGDWRMVVAEGQILGSKHDGMESPNGMFAFGSGPVRESFIEWARAGATHHAALLPGHHGASLAAACSILGIESTQV
jgi:L-arabinose isomerase